MAAAAATSSSQIIKTASTHTSAFVQGTHQFDIVGYSTLKKLSGGVVGAIRSNSVRSASFKAGGCTWTIVCSFGSDDNLQPFRVSLELTNKNDTRGVVVAVAALRIDDSTGAAPPVVWRSEQPRTFLAWLDVAETWNLPVPDAFRLNEARYVGEHDDCLTIHCTVGVLHEGSAAGPAASRDCFVSLVPPPTISKDIYRLLVDRTRPDVTFVLHDDTKVQAHKLVLAMRSPVFWAEFTGGVKEGSSGMVAIGDMTAATFRAMLYFIYTDELPKPKKEACTVDMARGLLVAADLYDLNRLRLMCENVLSESLTVGNVLSTLTVVHGRSSCRQLEDSCIDYIASRRGVYDAVKATEEYKEIKKIDASFINDVSEKVAARAVPPALGTASSSSASASSYSSSSGGRLEAPQKSASRSRYEPSPAVVVAGGTHEFRIENFVAIHMRHAAGKYIQSGTFMAGGHEWKMLVYPANGSDEEKVSVYLVIVNLHDPAARVKAAVTLKIDDPRPRGGLPAITRRFDYVYTANTTSLGFGEFTTVAAVRSGYVAHDGSLTLHCHIALTTESSSSSRTGTTVVGGPAIAVPPPNMAWHLEQLLESGYGSDVKFLADDQSEIIRAHGLVIAARSPVLHEAVLASSSSSSSRGGDTADDDEESVVVAVKMDGVSAPALRAVVHFIYTDELPRMAATGSDAATTTAVAGEMLGAAIRFGLGRMKRMCENRLAEKLTAANALATLEAARRHRCRELEKVCVEFIALPHVFRDVFNLKVD